MLMMAAATSASLGAERDTLHMSFIGDVMAHYRQLKVARIPGADSTKSSSYDFSSYYKYTRKWLEKSDISVANMENPVGLAPYTGYPIFSAPESIVTETVNAGVDLLLAANNHICDKGRRGLDSTWAVYQRTPARYTGMWRDTMDEQMNNPAIIMCRGFKIAFINFSYGFNGFEIPAPYVLGSMDSLQVKRAIARAKDRDADYIVALPHWGVEYNLDYSAEQRRWRDNLYRWGADMIVGSHPHVPQAVESKDGRITAYSLGNFISNMSIANGQIGILLNVSLVRNEDGTIEALPPEVIWLWCGRGGFFEENYTTIPIEEWLDRPDEFINRAQYDKMVREYTRIKQKFPQY